MCADFTVFGNLSSVRLAALAPRGRGGGGAHLTKDYDERGLLSRQLWKWAWTLNWTELEADPALWGEEELDVGKAEKSRSPVRPFR